MKVLFSLLFLCCAKFSNLQAQLMPDIAFHKIQNISLTYVDNVAKFSTQKWQTVSQMYWIKYFAIEKFWTGQQVKAVRVLGYWQLSKNAIAYLYVVDLVEGDDNIIPSIFISSYNENTQSKGIDINPFKQVASPTGLKGKIIVTETFCVTTNGTCITKATHKSSTSVFPKNLSFKILEDGSISNSK